MTAIGIIGGNGRMGRALIDALAQPAGLSLHGAIDAGGDPAALATGADVLIDFSVPTALAANLAAAQAAGVPIVIGTTGLDAEHHALIDEAARAIAVLQTGNTSIGVTLLARLVRDAAARLGASWDIEIIETHHRRKVDAPSGTALLLGQAAAAGRGVALAEVSTAHLATESGPRTPGTIGFASVRGGSVTGDHTVLLATDDERIELTHRAEDRRLFANGALHAARWIVAQAAGRYTMNDVLGFH